MDEMVKFVANILKRASHSDPLIDRFLTGLGCVLLLVILFVLPDFFDFIEKRKGITVADPVLNMMPAHNVSVLIFIILWGMGALTIFRSVKSATIFPIYVWTYLLICVSRVLSIYFVPLAPPDGLIPLKDPLTGIFYGKQKITHDLFYSGHTATLFLMFLCLEKRNDKLIAGFATLIVGVLLLVQRVHYSYDVIAAPPIVYGLHYLTKKYILIGLND